jgi:hypothetical protein
MIATNEKVAEVRATYGRTIHEILARRQHTDSYKLLGAIEVLVGSKIAQGLSTTPAERLVFALTWLAREVGAGGFRQFSINTAGDFSNDDADAIHPQLAVLEAGAKTIQAETEKDKPNRNLLDLTKDGMVTAAKTCAAIAPDLLKAATAIVDWFTKPTQTI